MQTLVGLGTLALALATFWLAWTTRAMARHSEAQVEASRIGVQFAHRPVIIPEVGMPAGDMRDADRGLSRSPLRVDDRLVVAVQNIGMGPALNIRGDAVTMAGPSTWGIGFVLHPVEGLAAGASRPVTFVAREGELGAYPELEIRLRYEDVAGHVYWTALHFNSSEGAYRSRVGEGDIPAAPLAAQGGSHGPSVTKTVDL